LYPEENTNKSSSGPVFDNPQANGKVQTGEDQVLDFVAQQAGTYEFECAKVCGMHHRMKGKLIIEE
jgi:heme/copper-type cytochrome/quinol oxidase subunit 2